MSNIVLETKGLTKYFYDPIKFQVLKQIDMSINHGEFVSIVGKSGCGKSTLLYLLSTMDTEYDGQLFINEELITGKSDKELAVIRNEKIGFVFQFHHLLPEFTALENVCIPAFIAGTSKNDSEKRAKELLEMLGLAERIEHKPSQLSGGEQQRVAVARALINNPAVILADEPSGNLDAKHSAELHQLFLNLKKELNQTFVIVTHNLDLANMADRKLTMKDGSFVG